MPPTKQIFSIVDKLIKVKSLIKFLITEEKKILLYTFVEKYGNLVSFYKSFRTNNRKEFDEC